MERTTLLKIGYEAAITINALVVIGWIFLQVFPGIFYLSEGEIALGFYSIFGNVWFYVFVITLGLAILFREYKEGKEEEIDEKNE